MQAARWGVVASFVVLSGCVSDERYREVLDQNEMLQKANAAFETDSARVKGELDDTKLLHKRAEADANREREARMATQVAFANLSEQTQELLRNVKTLEGVDVDLSTGKIRLLDAVLFETGRAEIRKEGEAVLKRLASVLKAEAVKGHHIRVEGHTDDQPVVANKDAYPTNWHLSGARALNVLLCLEANGLDSKDLSFAGFGEFQPREQNAPGHKGNKKNRRVEIRVIQ